MSAKPIATTRSATGIPTGRLAVWWLLASEVVIFGGLLGSYIMHRVGHPEWAEAAAHTQVWFGAFNTLVLLTSSFTAVLAHQAAESGQGKKAAKFLVMTMGGALTFLLVKSIEWTIEISHGYTITTNTFWSFYYTAAGLHGLHVIAGAIIMGFIAVDAWRGRELQRVELIGIYWHFVDLVWIFLFPLLYIAK
ncbi:MAG: cytochrome c oxidase subunit 3 [Gemmatimonadetes bacterium]|jgi:heme/copper-type cytochrome/quinol oxidase subunit 3|nr:cytochrome c oxidase subunit 3 [Gemmatimonadota bacterium]HAC05108.1 cytochrome oxidase subunit III [Gemmatimonadota bacterium]HIC54785.1 cytochrome oxidase subunit III [Gemmatimonadota bacterium]HIN50227.1 cytochrome oxidase subunit III [Gemmatimonadota bacterium]|tara:strand:+ start:80 stop:655 length:576 start_codon:yes stop_codon:yes gene_type:complete